jgi:plastocyanin
MAAVAAALALAAGVALGPGVLAAGGSRVLMVDNEPDLTNWHFEPAELTVSAGSTVVWHNDGKQDHTVTADDQAFDSGTKTPGTDWQRTFPKPGEFAYHCMPHPWMKGVVRVVATTGAVPSTTTTTSAPSSATVTTAVAETTTAAVAASPAAAPEGGRSRSGSGVVGTAALVLGLTVAALALGARLRRSKP